MASSNLGFIDVSMGLGSPEIPSLGGAGPEPGEGECVPMSLSLLSGQQFLGA